jgi:hypothetical protein
MFANHINTPYVNSKPPVFQILSGEGREWGAGGRHNWESTEGEQGGRVAKQGATSFEKFKKRCRVAISEKPPKIGTFPIPHNLAIF